MSYISVCKQVIQQNNKRGWKDPQPAIRVSKTASGKASARGHIVCIKDSEGNIVARIVSSSDGKPVTKAGAKVAIITKYDAEVLQ
jgi:hypothetical protein